MGSCARPENSRWIYWPLAQVGGGGEERASEASAPSNCRKKKRKEIRLWIFLRYKYKSLSIFSVYTFHFFHRNCNTWWSNVVSVVYVSKKSSNSHARYKMLYDSVREQGESMLVIFPVWPKDMMGALSTPTCSPAPKFANRISRSPLHRPAGRIRTSHEKQGKSCVLLSLSLSLSAPPN